MKENRLGIEYSITEKKIEQISNVIVWFAYITKSL